MSDPLIAVIIPCYNAEQTIEDAVLSALGQNWENKEIIVVDDGSTDASPSILSTFSEKIRVITTPNQGACAARNTGWQSSAAEWVQFLDADDILYPDKISRQYPHASGLTRAISFTGYHRQQGFDESTREAVQRHCPPGHPLEVASRTAMLTLGPLYPREALEEVNGFRVGLPCSQERDLHLRLAAKGWGFESFEGQLFCVRQFPGSLSSDILPVLKTHADIVENLIVQLKADHVFDERNRRVLAGILASDARTLVRVGEPDLARQYFARAAELHDDGGLDLAYSPATRLLRKWVGPIALDRMLKHFK